MTQQSPEFKEDPIETRLVSIDGGYATEDTPWISFSNELMDDYPKQGFKLHISATIINSGNIFDAVFPFLIQKKVPFKLVKSNKELYSMNTNNFGYSQVGKFFTVYPKNETEALSLAKELHQLTENFSSIQIPSDLPYKTGSNIFYRYGIFTGSGGKVDYLEDPDGNLVEDTRTNPIPEWITNPFKTKEPSKNVLLFNRFLIIEVLSQRAKGGVYRVLDFADRKSLPKIRVLKEARANGEIESSGVDAIERMKREEEALKKLENLTVIPNVIDFLEENQSCFLVLEEMGELSLSYYLYSKKKRFGRKKEIKFLIQLIDVLETIHYKGIIHTDLSANNIRISKDFTPSLVDFEHSFSSDTPCAVDQNGVFGTPGFYPPKEQLEFNKDRAQEYFEAREIYALGAILLTLVKAKWLKKIDRNPNKSFERLQEHVQTVDKHFKIIIKKACLLSSQKYENLSQLKRDLVALHDQLK